MFMVSEQEAAAIQAAWHRGGELAAVAELRRMFPVFQGNERAAEAARAIAGWRQRQVSEAGRRRMSSAPAED